MTEIVKIKGTDNIGYVECYEGNGEYIINLDNGGQGWFNEQELEFLNFEPHSNSREDVIRNLILLVNDNVKAFECMDIDNEYFIDVICEKSGLSKDEYMEIMKLEEEPDEDEDEIEE